LVKSLSFRHVQDDVCEEFIDLFKDGHSPFSAVYTYEDKLHLSASNEQELLEVLADRTINPGYNYVTKLFQQYREAALGSSNGKLMFERLADMVQDYNSLGQGRAILQEYDTHAGKAFIMCIVTNLMCRVHERVLQAGELCYVDASASFDPLNS
jgi:hypothetical protein